MKESSAVEKSKYKFKLKFWWNFGKTIHRDWIREMENMKRRKIKCITWMSIEIGKWISNRCSSTWWARTWKLYVEIEITRERKENSKQCRIIILFWRNFSNTISYVVGNEVTGSKNQAKQKKERRRKKYVKRKSMTEEK